MNIFQYLLILSMSLFLVSCDKDSEADSADNGLMGLWEGSFQNLKASEGGTYPVQVLFKDDGRFDITNLESKVEVSGHYESYLSLKAVTLKVFGENENELSNIEILEILGNLISRSKINSYYRKNINFIT